MPYTKCLRESPKELDKLQDNVVRERLLKLMGSETVKILDRNFMATFAERLSNQKWEEVQSRIEERERWEKEREKHLVLNGMLPSIECLNNISEYSYFAIMRQVAIDVADRKAKMEAHQDRKRKRKTMDYSLLPITFAEEADDSTLSARMLIQAAGKKDSFDLLLDMDDRDGNGKDSGETSRESDVEWKSELDGRTTTAVRYEAPVVKELRGAKTVEEMYSLADSIFLDIVQQRSRQQLQDDAVFSNISAM